MLHHTTTHLDAARRGLDRRIDLHARLLGAGPRVPDDAVVLRHATDDDRIALRALAAREGRDVPREPVLLALAVGRPIAAIGLTDRKVLADPDWPTGRAVDALQAAAAEHSPWPARIARLRALLARRRGPALRDRPSAR
ncbi:hypothetical protein [Patulibacter sp.]|uniref:hypothetical protein n=1 Tax=Patulibacter sp. TaxID=1912859 RepID=UPI0027167FF6|nr:hypothetical protein [Patulibacter sp.]MDO9409467.1 hypothetical protein [Patulibacter sp.]